MEERDRILLRLKELWEEIKKIENKKDKKKKELKNQLKAELEKFLEIEEIPIYPREILKEIAGKSWRNLYWMIEYNWGINEIFFRKIFEKKGGSPIKIKIGERRDFYVFKNFPKVYLSTTGMNPDVAFFPKVISPDTEIVGELTAIILFKGNGQIIGKKGKFVNQINVVGKEEMIFRVRESISKIFGVPENFSRVYLLKNLKRKISINSLMVGTYFQNLVGIFEVDEDKSVFLKEPYKIGQRFRKGFIEGTIKWKGEKISQKTSKIRTSWRRINVLEVFKKYADEAEIKTSKIYPILSNQTKILPKKNFEKKMTGEIKSMIPVGKWARVFSQDKLEVGIVVETNKKELEIEIEKENFKPPLFIEKEYQLFINKH